MSGSDDTEELLRAAPLDPRLGAGVVSGLASRVDSIQARLRNLENASFSESVVSAREYFRFANSPNKKIYRTPVKYSTAKINGSDKFHTLPKRRRNRCRQGNLPELSPLALHNTDKKLMEKKSSDNKLHHLIVDSFVSDVEKLSDFSKDSFYSGDLSGMDSESCISLCSLEKKLDKSMLLEIDAFLNNIAKADSMANDWGFPCVGLQSLKDIDNNHSIGKFEPPDIASKYIGTQFYSNIEEKQMNPATNCIKIEPSVVKSLFCNSPAKDSTSDCVTFDNISHKIKDVMISDKKHDFLEAKEEAHGETVISDESPIKKQIKNININIEADILQDDGILVPDTLSLSKENLGCFNRRDSLIINNTPINNPSKNLHNSKQSIMSVNDTVQKKSFALPSLMELWSNASESKITNSYVEPQRFEEEKLRRKHCENIIQQLQKKILEQQQKLAVAIQVDATKDDVINKLKESCSRTENHYLAQEEDYKKNIQNLNSQLKNATNVNSEMKKDLDNYEKRFEKMMALLNDKEEKYNNIIAERNGDRAKAEKDIAEFKLLLSEKEAKIKGLNDSHSLFVDMNKQITENYNTTQLNSEKIKEENKKLTERSNKMQERLRSLENEVDDLNATKNEYLSRIAEEKSRNSHLDGQKSKLQISLDAAYRQIEQLETEKNDLKILYQKQVNEIITKKASEFQNEFDTAQSQMTAQMREKEKEIALQFARHLNKIEQHHQFEISKLEQTQKQHIEMYKIQLNKSSSIIQQLEEKLASYKERRGEIAAQLHNVMQSQWQQALKIITNDSNAKNQNNDSERSNSVKSTHEKDTKFEKPTSQRAHRHETKIEKLPETIANDTEVRLTDDQLQHYVKILLNKIPGISETLRSNNDDVDLKSKLKSLKFDTLDKNMQEFEYPTSDKANENSERKFDKHFGMKPPWK